METGFCKHDADDDVEVTDDGCQAVGRPGRKNKWSGVRGRPGVLSGAYQFEIVLQEACLLRVGWAAATSSRTVGLDNMSFGYGGTAMKSTNRKFEKYGEEYHEAAGSVISCLIDRSDPSSETISFCVDGRPLGVAFALPLELAGVPLFPAVSGKESWRAECRCSNFAFPEADYRPLQDAVNAGDAVSGPLVLGLCAGDADACIDISADGCRAACQPEAVRNGWWGVRGRPGVLRGKYLFEVELESECLLRVGWSALRTKRAIGNDARSFGYGGTAKKATSGNYSDYGDKFEGRIGAVVSCLIDRSTQDQQTISFCLDGQSFGVAFEIPADLIAEPLFPAVCGRGEWHARCRYSDFRFPQDGVRPLSEALAARDAVVGLGIPGSVAPPKGVPIVPSRVNRTAELEALAQASSIPQEGIVPGKRVVLHVRSGPWQGWYVCVVVDTDPLACYLKHESDGYTENVPWAFLNAGKYSMELLPDEAGVATPDAREIPAAISGTCEGGNSTHFQPESIDPVSTGDNASDEKPLLRTHRLRVHDDLGAGVTLVMCETGYFVSRIELPGQPGLKKGDVVVAINGAMLLGLEDDKLEETFSNGFFDGSLMVVGNYLKVRQQPFTKVRREIDELWKKPECPSTGGYAQAAEQQLPRDGPPVLARSVSTRSNAGCGVLRRGRLCLDFRSGRAGLELSACDAGYLVDEIEPSPGQRDLKVGDAIVAIGGSLLMGLDADEVDQRFGDAYCDGAILVAGPYEDLMRWPFDVVKSEVERLLVPSSWSALLTERARTY